MSRTLIVTLAMLLAAPTLARADEAVVLSDGSTITGKILHYYDGVLTVRLPGGQRLRLPSRKIKRLRFQLPKPRAALSTPRKAFKRMRTAALAGDLSTYVDAYASTYQMLLSNQISMTTPKAFRAQLKKQWGSAQLEVLGAKIKGATAKLLVRRRGGGRAATGALHFIRENREWKMVMPL